MVKNFTRTITVTKVVASKINLETLGVIGSYELEVNEDLTKEEIIKMLIKKHGKPSLTEAYVVNDIKKNDVTYSLSLEDFFKYAKIVEPKTKQEEKQEDKTYQDTDSVKDDVNTNTEKVEENKKALNEKHGKAGK